MHYCRNGAIQSLHSFVKPTFVDSRILWSCKSYSLLHEVLQPVLHRERQGGGLCRQEAGGEEPVQHQSGLGGLQGGHQGENVGGYLLWGVS